MKIMDFKGQEQTTMAGPGVTDSTKAPQAPQAPKGPTTAGHELVEKLLIKLLGQMGIQRPEDTAKEWIAECQK